MYAGIPAPMSTIGGKKPARKGKSITKAQFVGLIAEATNLKKAQIGEVLDAFAKVAVAELKADNPLTIPGLVKITPSHRAAKPAHMGIRPGTKEPMMIKAKPARRAIRARPVKSLKDQI